MVLLELVETFTGTAKKGHSSDPDALKDLLRVTSYAILEVFILCLVGYYLGQKRIVDSKTKRTLNKLNQNVFTPSLLASKIMFTLTPQKLLELWIVPVGFVLVSLISALVAWAMGTMFRLSKSQRAFAIACAMFMNSNSLPIALMQSLTYTVDALRWGPHDSREAMQGRALTYLVLFSTLGIILRWSYGIKLLSTADSEAPKPDPEDAVALANGNSRQNGGIESEQNHDVRAPLLQRINEDQETAASTAANTPKQPRFSDGPATLGRPGAGPLSRRKPERRWTALGHGEDLDDADFFQRSLSFNQKSRNFRKEISDYRSFPNTPSRTPAASTYTSSENGDSRSVSDDDDEDDYEGLGRRGTEQSTSAFQAKMRRARRKTAQALHKAWRPIRDFLRGVQAFMTAPLYAALLSLIVACIPPVQRFLDELQPVRNAIKSAGNCSVPITLIVLGSYFVEQPDASEEAASKASKRKSALKKRASTASSLRERFSAMFSLPSSKKKDDGSQEKGKPGEGRTIFVSVTSRMIVAPLIMIPLLAWWSIKTVNVADDPVFIVTAVLVITSAPAITLAQMTQASGASFERLISKTLFYSYVVVTFPTVIAAVLIGLEIAERQ